MADRPMDLYLNDHMSGAALGSRLAAQIRDRNAGTERGEIIAAIAAEIEQDRRELDGLIVALGVRGNPLKRVGGWVAEKWSRVKFSGAAGGHRAHGDFMAVETLTLGVAGKRCLWLSLRSVVDRYEAIEAADIERLIDRANAQLEVLERCRLQAATELLGTSA